MGLVPVGLVRCYRRDRTNRKRGEWDGGSASDGFETEEMVFDG